MITLEEEYKANIRNMFRDIGEEWLEKIPKLIEKYTQEFHLTNVRINEHLTYNVLLFADSIAYGPIILKIEIPFKEMTIRESKALELNQGEGACKCYYKDIDDGVLMIERLFPGNSLNDIKDLEERVKVFADVSRKFNKIVETDELPTYKDILYRSINMAFEQDRFEDIREYASIASKMYEKIDNQNQNQYLLHSDLYTDNILLSGNTWKAIDPHGFVGNKIFDTAIFIQKELDKIGYTKENMDLMFLLMEEYCGYSQEELQESFFINYLLNICWDKEVNLDTTKSMERLKRIYEYIREYKEQNEFNNQPKILKK